MPRLCHERGGELVQIQFLLGHVRRRSATWDANTGSETPSTIRSASSLSWLNLDAGRLVESIWAKLSERLRSGLFGILGERGRSRQLVAMSGNSGGELRGQISPGSMCRLRE